MVTSPNSALSRSLVTVVTRLKTTNIGNEALSSELISLIKNKFPNYKICPLERAPRFLDQYYSTMLSKDLATALKQFEYWAQFIAKKISFISPITLDKDFSSSVTLIRKNRTPSWKPFIEKKLHLRALKSRLGLYDDEMLKRLAIYQFSTLTILNPGGEFQPKSIESALKILLELRVAQILGSKVGIVNFSYEIEDEFISMFFIKIISQFDFIRVRDSLSLQNLVSRGLDKNTASVIGDLVFLTEPESQDISNSLTQKFNITPNTVAVVINTVLGTSSINDWARIINFLKEKYNDVALISNEISSDFPILQSISRLTPTRIISEQFSYRTYAALLRNFDLVVSSRLHTMILSMLVNTTVVPIEPLNSRMKGQMEDIKYPIPVTSVFETDWTSQVIEIINSTTLDKKLKQKISELVEEQKVKISQDFNFLETLW
ncbi:polysaccharide pyruvyl transferase family protein [Geminocystis sp. GBBB08]|uniref:polysaccharide pyruvyl transferase family protein n=1 Tax=Geminocystis sp. GBBB08 TaxID=2604140 RepID=UPI0027E3A5F8|nr:polysaccharide pyruvyl transferase family protein [Geminocystis sp. GBBB08]MBL1209496.1 polysaccharide pyruvyl transferase family protein [Geminocystis sp. GBBB08]